jgi:type II secretory pathway component HofQ
MALPVTGLRWLGAVGVLGGVWWFTALHAAPVNNDPDAKARADSPAERIRKALDKTISFKSDSESLAEAINHLREQTKINIVLDQTLMNQAFPVGGPVSVALENAKVRTVLQAMLNQYGQHNLGYAIVGGMLLVTTEQQAVQKQVQQRVSVNYDGVPIKTALQQLARETAVNLLLDPRAAKDATNPITLRLNDVPLELTVKLIAEMADLKLV